MAIGFTPVNKELEQQEKVYADLVSIYPDNETYLRKYAEILLEAGKPSTAEYSEPNRPAIPTVTGHPFRHKPAGDSDGNRPPCNGMKM